MPRRKQPVMMTLRVPLSAKQYEDLQSHLTTAQSTEGPADFARRAILQAVNEILERRKK